MNNHKIVQRVTISGLFLLFFVGFNLLDHTKTLLSMTSMHYYFKEWGFLKTAYYWSAYAASISAILIVLFSRSSIVRWLGLGLLGLFLSIELSYQFINGYGTGFFEVLVALWEYSFAKQALTTFGPDIWSGIGLALLLTAALATLVRFVKIRFKLKWLGLIPLALVMTYSIIWKTLAGTDQFPPVFKIPLLALYTTHSPMASKREPIALETPQNERAKHLIFIIDESVRGDYFQINGYPRETTPYLDTIRDRLINLGIACSSANCSQTSNIILQSGLRLDQLPDREERTLKAPNIFAYAKAAGYKTFFLEGQYEPGQLPPHMSKFDLDYIDEFFQVDPDDTTKSGYKTDYTLADHIKEILASESHAFILVNKRGVHFNYENDYPPSEKHFKPTLVYEQVTRQNKFDVYKTTDRNRMINSYCNGIRWAVDGFFKDLLPSLNLDEVVLVYTSDHGQSLKDDNSSSTHCTTFHPPSTHAIVPLFLMGNYLQKYFGDDVSNLQNEMSHFQIFPSLLYLMGYNGKNVQEKYGAPLWMPNNHVRYFVSGDLFGRGSNFGLNEFEFEPDNHGSVVSQHKSPEHALVGSGL